MLKATQIKHPRVIQTMESVISPTALTAIFFFLFFLLQKFHFFSFFIEVLLSLELMLSIESFAVANFIESALERFIWFLNFSVNATSSLIIWSFSLIILKFELYFSNSSEQLPHVSFVIRNEPKFINVTSVFLVTKQKDYHAPSSCWIQIWTQTWNLIFFLSFKFERSSTDITICDKIILKWPLRTKSNL